MKFVVKLIILLPLFIFGCSGSSTEKDEDSSEVGVEESEEFNCDNFFEKGDYSNLCLTSKKLPNDIVPESSVGKIHCDYLLFEDGENEKTTKKAIKVSFMTFGDADGAMQIYEANKERVIEGNPGAVTEFEISGTEAYLTDVTRGDNVSKNITFLKGKIMVSVIVVYYIPWTLEIPCFYENEELKKLAVEIHSNF
jgi:hypothetical protein